MRIAIGTDHRGFTARDELAARLRALGHDVLDVGAPPPAPADYPDPAVAVGQAVARGRCERGVLLCGTGIGVSIAANKVPGVRAARCGSVADAVASRRHNDANVICLGADALTVAQAWDIVQAWLAEAFEGGRHARRVEKIARYEADRDRPQAARAPEGKANDGR